MNDAYGKGLLAYWNGKKDAFFTVESDIAETEEWQVGLFFRMYEDMPELEKTALRNVEGSILDAGAGAGSHALYLQDKGADVTAIDISAGAVEVMRNRGLKKVIQADFFRFNGGKFDTLLLLMNGIGIAGNINKLPLFFARAKELLNPGGKILLDSSDILYLFEDEEDGSVMIDLNDRYYGELEYTFAFGNEKDDPFEWLFIDFDTLSAYADKCGFTCRKIYEDEHYQYLAELKLKD